MPGLTPDQQSLMLEKAAGNFLTMVENVGQLLRVPANFVERRITGALCPAGERVVREWQSERHKRVEQRFTELTPEVQDLLGWSSHLGVSFLHEVVEDFADQVAGHPRAAALLQECVDPLVILGRPNDLLREFRDRAFHDVAKHYFANYGQEHAAPLEAILRKHLAEWVNNGFDDDGQLISDGRERSAMTLPTSERRDFLGMAVSALRPSATDLWEEARSIVWIRAMYLLVITDWEESLWNRVQQHGKELTKAQVNWDTVPQSALFYIQRQWLAGVMLTSGALECALELWKADHGRSMMANLGFPQRRRDVVTALENIASIEGRLGDLKSALARYEEGLEIRRALVTDLGTPESRRDVSVSLNQVASIKHELGDLDGALAHYGEGLEIRRALLAELGTPESRRDVSIALNCIASIEEARSDPRGALARYEEGLEIRRALVAELRTPQSRRDVSFSLDNVASTKRVLGDLDGALARYEEGLEIRRALMA
jgi:tetratricopeptide (TPR) repeat protein